MTLVLVCLTERWTMPEVQLPQLQAVLPDLQLPKLQVVPSDFGPTLLP